MMTWIKFEISPYLKFDLFYLRTTKITISNMFDFEEKVIQKSYSHPVIVEFSSPGCGPCLWMEKTLVEVVKEFIGTVHFVSLPLSDCAECIEKYKIKSNPTTILFSNGKPQAQLRGALPKMVVKQWIQDHIKIDTKNQPN